MYKSQPHIMFAKILLPIAFEPLDYKVPSNISLELGDLVWVPFRNGFHIGMVMGTQQETEIAPEKMRVIKARFPMHLDLETRDFMHWIAWYTYSSLGLIFKMFIGSLKPDQLAQKAEKSVSNIEFSYRQVPLNTTQKEAANHIKTAVYAKSFFPVLLDGITGSGKTEVYFEALQVCLEEQKTALVLLPEINLTSAWLTRFEKRFGRLPYQWHSHLTPKQRLSTWSAVIHGQARVIVGTRSALCLPHQNLGLIVVDEEHDASFKQETTVRYHARDMAVRRAQMAKCPIVLSSATPSVETLLNVQDGKYKKLQLPFRYGNAEMPAMHAIDMRQETLEKDSYISAPLWQALEANKAQGQQALLFINRRGFAPVVICQSCGSSQVCLSCDVGLVYHQKKNSLVCHYCGYIRSVQSKCFDCKETDSYVFFGPGVEKIQHEVLTKYPTWRTLLMTSDTLTTAKKIQESMQQIEQGDVDVIIATQSMAKGHHFPNLTLVGIIDATLGHMEYDLRVTERAYQVLHQVAGRSGRATKKGHVYLQTYQPDQTAFQALCAHERSVFFKLELEKRQVLGLPPYGRLTAVIIEGKKEDSVKNFSIKLAQTFPKETGIQLLGPVAAPLSRLKKYYRWRLLLKSEKAILHQATLDKWLKRISVPPYLRVHIDIDPYSFV
jgi:primosomal protein N' (replication factor Y)